MRIMVLILRLRGWMAKDSARTPTPRATREVSTVGATTLGLLPFAVHNHYEIAPRCASEV